MRLVLYFLSHRIILISTLSLRHALWKSLYSFPCFPLCYGGAPWGFYVINNISFGVTMVKLKYWTLVGSHCILLAWCVFLAQILTSLNVCKLMCSLDLSVRLLFSFHSRCCDLFKVFSWWHLWRKNNYADRNPLLRLFILWTNIFSIIALDTCTVSFYIRFLVECLHWWRIAFMLELPSLPLF